MNCYNDWAEEFMDRAIDQISGRLHKPKILTEENAWQKRRRYHWEGGNYRNSYVWYNIFTQRFIEITEQEFENQQQPIL